MQWWTVSDESQGAGDKTGAGEAELWGNCYLEAAQESVIIGLGVFRAARRREAGRRVQVLRRVGQTLLPLNSEPLPCAPPGFADGASPQQQRTIPFLIYIQRANFSPGRQGETVRSSGAQRCQT